MSDAELQKVAGKQTGTAARAGGGSGDEVASFPSVPLDGLAMFSKMVLKMEGVLVVASSADPAAVAFSRAETAEPDATCMYLARSLFG